MIGAYARLVRLLDRRETGEPLAAFRICVGLILAHHLLVMGLDGLVPLLWMDLPDGGMRPLAEEGSWWVGLLGGPHPGVVWPLYALTLAASIGLTVGLYARVQAFLALQGFLALAWINGHAGGSYDNLISNSLWLLVLARSDATASILCRIRTGSFFSNEEVQAWPRWLVVLQLVAMYASTGLQKVSAAWVPGGDFSALYYILQQPTWARWDMAWLAWIYPLTQLATGATWFFEVGSPVLLLFFYYRLTADRPGRLRAWCNRLDARSLFAAVGISMHLGIHLLMVVGPFSTLSIALYACLFSPDEWRRGARRLRSAFSRGPAPAPPGPTEASLPGS